MTLEIFLTIELISILVLVWGEWQYWATTSNWRSDDGGLSHTYTYQIKNKYIQAQTRHASVVISVIGLLVLIWL